ncbi:MAG: hypothetical protein KJ000_23975 [Pirellulaceae bacterium]|nr:hypothetical protein [Pirellulaceae bacterium]
MSRARMFFPQDEIWKSASEVELKLMKVDARWYVTYKIQGTIGKDPFCDDDEVDDGDGGLAEPQEEIDTVELVRAIVADLAGKKVRQD